MSLRVTEETCHPSDAYDSVFKDRGDCTSRACGLRRAVPTFGTRRVRKPENRVKNFFCFVGKLFGGFDSNETAELRFEFAAEAQTLRRSALPLDA